MTGVEHAIQFLSNDYHFPSSGAKAEAKEIVSKLQKQNPSVIEVEKSLTLSTAHINPETDHILKHRRVPFDVYSHEYGYYIPVRSRFKEDMESFESVPVLRPLIEYAIKHECTMINLDRDAGTTSDLPTFDW
jgi:hypothetical protein